ncbi:MAG TPA: PBP1A family penicillin-binding protein [Longimicrobiales bacterium]|nr:PBP1A family penicillin-binding protein [Longimicrobiales bacterium]
MDAWRRIRLRLERGLRALGRQAGITGAALRREAGPAAAAFRRRAGIAGAALGRRGRAAGLAIRAGSGAVLRHLRPQYILAAGAAVLIAASLLYSNCGFSGCPDIRQLTAYQPGGAPVLLDRNGDKFADLAPYERVVVSLDSLPPHVANAFIAVEDRRFWRHNGVDWVRVLGAAAANVRARGVTQGSSTIPMQLARNIFPRELPGSERTLKRKLQEARVAQRIESRFTKAEILEMYLNHIYFGGGAYGVEAAARLYFGKGAAELTLAESATLAALPKAPSHYDPRRHVERSQNRRDLVLELMAQQRLVDSVAVAEARATELVVRTDSERNREGVPLGFSFIDAIREMLEDRFGENLYRSRVRIHTTLDPVAQRAAERELERQLDDLSGRVRSGEGELQGSVVVMEAGTGDVLALVGARNPTTSRYNRAIHARRQVGSAFKPFVFAAALDEGIPTSQLVADVPLRMQLSRNDVWEPSNYDGTYEGDVSLRHALVRSRNIPTVRLASAVGIEDVARTAQQAGVAAPMDVTPALSLGTVAMSPLQLATAYTTFATLGRTAEPRFVVRVEDEDGRVLWQPQRRPARQGLDPAVAYIVTDILRDAVDYGTGTGVRSAGFRAPAAGKTGTTNNATDAWFVGYTPDVVGAVWIGYDRPSSLGSAATGGGFAAPVWGRIMRQVYAERPQPAQWEPPADIVHRRVDPGTGLVLQDGCEPSGGGARVEIFVASAVPATACPYRDFWSDFWNRVGGAFGRDRDGGRDNRDNVLGGRDVRVESERRGPPQTPPGRGNNPGADRGRRGVDPVEEFLRQRSEELRRRQQQNGSGRGGGVLLN